MDHVLSIGDQLCIGIGVHASTGAMIDADSAPTYRIYKPGQDTPLVTGGLTIRDSTNTDGYYYAERTLTAADGFERGKSYDVLIRAIVGGITGGCIDKLYLTRRTDREEAILFQGIAASGSIGGLVLPTGGIYPSAYPNLQYNYVMYVDSETPPNIETRVISGSSGTGNVTLSVDAPWIAPVGAISFFVFAAPPAPTSDPPTFALETATQTQIDQLAVDQALVLAKTNLIPGTQDGKTFSETLLLMAAVLLGKSSGLGTPTAVFQAINDSKARVTAQVDAEGNRSVITLDAT